MGLAGVDAPGFDLEAGGGEEGVMLFRRFSIAASMLSRSAMSKMRVGWFGAEEGFYIRLKGTTTLVDRRDQESVFQKRPMIGRARVNWDDMERYSSTRDQPSPPLIVSSTSVVPIGRSFERQSKSGDPP